MNWSNQLDENPGKRPESAPWSHNEPQKKKKSKKKRIKW